MILIFPGTNHEKIEQILKDVVVFVIMKIERSDFLDKIFLHPVFGLITLAVMMFMIFQAVFAWAAAIYGWHSKASSVGLVNRWCIHFHIHS